RRGTFAHYCWKPHVDRTSQPDHLTRNSLLPLIIRGEVESPVSLDVTVIALHAERVVKSIHELQDHRPRSVFRPDLQIRHRRWGLLGSSAPGRGPKRPNHPKNKIRKPDTA